MAKVKITATTGRMSSKIGTATAGSVRMSNSVGNTSLVAGAPRTQASDNRNVNSIQFGSVATGIGRSR